MKRALLIAIALFLFAYPCFCAVSTSDGAITLDFYEDTQLGVDNLWILDFTVNDIDGVGGVETLGFDLIFFNEVMDLNNQYNLHTEYYIIGYLAGSHAESWPLISTNILTTPVEETFKFYALPTNGGEPVLGEFWVKLDYSDNLGNQSAEFLPLTGPVDFAPVPEPVGISLFLFGAFLLKYLTRKVF